MKRPIFFFVMFFAALLFIFSAQFNKKPQTGSTQPNVRVVQGSNHDRRYIDQAALIPDWSAIATWPPGSTEEVDTVAEVDPWQVTTMIVLDDSGSMEGRIDQAKSAITDAVAQFDARSRVGVMALNAGLVAEVVAAGDAALLLPDQLKPIVAAGNTPLGSRLDDAARILENEASERRGFGVFRILVTTDGAASDADRLNRAVSQILSETPIELATIGIGIGEGHALNVPGFTSYVSVNGVDGLANALAAAAAEQINFQPIDRFEE